MCRLLKGDVMGKTELVKSGLFYTYGHYLNGNLIYLGEGKGQRAWDFWDKSYRDQRDHVQVRIFGIFDNKELAVFNEGLLIHQERMEGNVHLLNKSDYGRGRRGCKHSEETKQKLSAVNSGENHPNFGKQLSNETRKKLSEAHIGKKSAKFKGLTIGTNTNNKIIVFCGNADMKSRGFSPGNISYVINGKKPHYKKFLFTRSSDPIFLQQLLDEDNFVDDVSKERIKEFLSQ